MILCIYNRMIIFSSDQFYCAPIMKIKQSVDMINKSNSETISKLFLSLV